MSAEVMYDGQMRIAFLCKRRYMSKDVIVDRYARLYEMPRQLARREHEVLCVCLSYADASEGRWVHMDGANAVAWQSWSIGRSGLFGLWRYATQSYEAIRSFAPDVIVGASDIPHVGYAAWLSHRLRVPLAVDLYDNFESFGQSRVPGMKGLLRLAVRGAAITCCTSEALRRYVLERYRAPGNVITLPSTVDKGIFLARDQKEARSSLGLPMEAKLIGTAGSLRGAKGITTVYQAFQKLSEDSAVHLVLAGPCDVPPPAHARVHYLGELPHERTAQLLAALDVGIIYLRDTPFGRYCFPQKAYEMLACGIPVVGARVGATADLLADAPQCIYEPDDAASLADAIRRQLDTPVVIRTPIRDWAELVGDLEKALLKAVADHH